MSPRNLRILRRSSPRSDSPRRYGQRQRHWPRSSPQSTRHVCGALSRWLSSAQAPAHVAWRLHPPAPARWRSLTRRSRCRSYSETQPQIVRSVPSASSYSNGRAQQNAVACTRNYRVEPTCCSLPTASTRSTAKSTRARSRPQSQPYSTDRFVCRMPQIRSRWSRRRAAGEASRERRRENEWEGRRRVYSCRVPPSLGSWYSVSSCLGG